MDSLSKGMGEGTVGGIGQCFGDATDRQAGQREQFAGDREAHLVLDRLEAGARSRKMPGERAGLEVEVASHRISTGFAKHQAWA